MAVRIDDFYQRHFVKYLIIAVALQVALATVVAYSVWATYAAGTLRGPSLIFTAVMLFVPLQSVLTAYILRLFGVPLQILAEAITHVSNHPNATPPPNISKASFERSGLKALVQTVYELSLASFQANTGMNEAGTEEPKIALKNVMDLLPCDLIVLDKHGEVSFFHGSDGLTRMANGAMKLKLQFPAENGLEEWLETCRNNKVHDRMVWKRIQNATLGQENRKVFDVVAHYEMSDREDVETVIVLIDRTLDYARGEDDMDFIALAAHELRGPITVIRGYLDVLSSELGKELKDDQKVLLSRMSVSAERLASYINNILNVSKYDRAHLKLHLREEKLSDIIESINDDIRLRASTQRRVLKIEIPEGLPTVAADASSFSEVIGNLVDNAIKYSFDDGEIVVRAVVKGEFVELTVQDFGIGMPSAVVGNLFNKFYRSHRSRQTVNGTGLGLYISKAIVESHGGKIWAASTEGTGSVFGVMLPIYSTVADKLKTGDNGNENIIESSHGWIKNHSLYRG